MDNGIDTLFYQNLCEVDCMATFFFFLQGCLCKLMLYVSLSTGMTFRQVFVENSELRSNTEAC